VRCLTCQVDVRLPTTASALVVEARRFFGLHGDCLTSLDLRSYRVLARALAYERTPAPRASGE
jgi:hypothetical protein